MFGRVAAQTPSSPHADLLLYRGTVQYEYLPRYSSKPMRGRNVARNHRELSGQFLRQYSAIVTVTGTMTP